MSYDHYWTRPIHLDPARFLAWTHDFRTVTEYLPSGFLAGPLGEGDPVITDTWVSFDGNAHPTPEDFTAAVSFFRAHGDHRQADLLSYQAISSGSPIVFGNFAFSIERDQTAGYAIMPGRYWTNVPTNKRPYDAAVTAALILLAYHFPVVRVTSDGDFAAWRLGHEIIHEALGISLPIPIGEYRVEWIEAPDHIRFAAWSRDVVAIIAAASIPLVGPQKTGTPIVDDNIVAFNGVESDGYDPILIARDILPNGGIWRFQTLDKPYSEIVVAILILWAYHFPNPYQQVFPTVYIKTDPVIWRRGCDLVGRVTSVALTINTDTYGGVTVV